MDRHQLSSPDDYVEVYDGPDANGRLLAIWSPDGFSETPVVAQSGVAYITFKSDNSYTVLSGFLIVWHSHTLCPNQCSSRGYCFHNGCTCFHGYSGVDCSQPLSSYEILKPGVVRTGVVNDFEFKNYIVTVTAPTPALRVNFSRVALNTPPKGRWGGGEILFAMNYGSPPDVTKRVWVYWLTATAFIVENPDLGDYYFTVYGQEAAGYIIEVQPFAKPAPPVLPPGSVLPAGAVAGIIIAVVVVALVSAAVGACIIIRRRRATRFNQMKEEESRSSEQK
jgi:hypothetical protein